jgi:hypothetical protein
MAEHHTAPSPEPVDRKSEFVDSELSALGIIAHQHTSYEWNGYRYSNAADAVAAARREAR